MIKHNIIDSKVNSPAYGGPHPPLHGYSSLYSYRVQCMPNPHCSTHSTSFGSWSSYSCIHAACAGCSPVISASPSR